MKSVILTGATAEKIFDTICRCRDFDRKKIKVCIEKDFESAVRLSASFAKNGDAVLLSPACASFDVFPNFEKRGEFFSEIVRSI